MKGSLRWSEEQFREDAAKRSRWQRGSEIVNTESTSGGVESRHAAVSRESRSTLESARKGSAAIAPSVTASPRREGAAGVAPGPLTSTPAAPAHPLSARAVTSLAAAPAGTLYALVALCRAAGLLEPIPEYQFHPSRRWRADYAFPHTSPRVIVEIDGGVWSQGRHTRGAGFIEDQRKLNAAALLGYHVLRYTPDRLGECVADLRVIFAGRA